MPSALIRVLGEPVSTESGTPRQDGWERHPGGPAEGSQAPRPVGAGLCWKGWEAAWAGPRVSALFLGVSGSPSSLRGREAPFAHGRTWKGSVHSTHGGEGRDPTFPPHPS